MKLECPVCEAEIEVEDDDLEDGIEIECEECLTELTVVADIDGSFELQDTDDTLWDPDTEADEAAMKAALDTEASEDDADDLDADLDDDDAEDADDEPKPAD